MLNPLEAGALNVIDLDQGMIGSRPVRVTKLVSDFSDIGKQCNTRARIEFQRRFLGSTSDTLLPKCGPVVISERQLLATLLDLRTARGGHLTPAQRTLFTTTIFTIKKASEAKFHKAKPERKYGEPQILSGRISAGSLVPELKSGSKCSLGALVSGSNLRST